MSEELEIINVDEVSVFQKERGADAIIRAIREKFEGLTFDVSTAKGRDECRSAAAKIAKTKVALDEQGKSLTEQWRVLTGVVNGERKRLRDELDELKDKVREPLTAWEEAEKERVRLEQERIAKVAELKARIENWDTNLAFLTASEMQAKTSELEALDVPAELADVKAQSLERCLKLVDMQRKQEAEKAELDKLRKEAEEREKAEQARIAAEKAEAERKAREEQIRKEAEEKAKREAEEREAKRIAEEKARKEAEEREAKRIADEKAKREADHAHRAKINNAIMAKFIELGCTEEDAKAIIVSVAKLQIPNIQINY